MKNIFSFPFRIKQLRVLFEAMGNKFSSLTQIHKNALKCYLAVNHHCQQCLIQIMHNNGIPDDPEELYKFFDANKGKILQLRKQKVLFDDQVDLLLPQNQRTFSQKWDITLICVVIINFSTLPPPKGGWKIKVPDPTDFTAASYVIKTRKRRNEMNHATLDSLKDEKTFNDTFSEVEDLLVGLNYTKLVEFQEMNSKSFDPALFMDTIQCPKVEKDVFAKLLQWYKDENERSKFLF